MGDPVDRAVLDDPELADLIDREMQRRATTLQLIASETPPTPAVQEALASGLAAKYAEGYPGMRYHGGCDVVDEVEQLAVARAEALFDADYVNVQPLSGSAANLAVYAAFAQLGDPILALQLKHGAHQTHGSRANFSGRWFSALTYGLRKSDETIDYDEIRDLALLHRPRMIVAGAASYSRFIDFAALRSIADETDAILWVDAAHLAGLVAGGVAPSPMPFADVVTVATHKVFRGPRGGMVLAAGRHRDALARAVYPFVQGGPALNSIAAKAVCMRESAAPDFAAYIREVISAAARLSAELGTRGYRTVSGGTDTHLAVIDVSARGLTGREAQRRLDAAGITVDRSVLPFDERPPAQGSAIRVGTPAAVVSGVGTAQMPIVAECIDRALRSAVGAGEHARIRAEVAELSGE